MMRLLLATFAVFFAFPAFAAPTNTPSGVVQHLYDVQQKNDDLFREYTKARDAGDETLASEYFAKYAAGQKTNPYFNHAQRDRFFSAKFNDLSRDEEMAARVEERKERLTFDPVSFSEEPSVSDVRISTPMIEKNTATVVVGFMNEDKPKTLSYSLVREEGIWKVDNIVSLVPKKVDLAQIFAGTSEESSIASAK